MRAGSRTPYGGLTGAQRGLVQQVAGPVDQPGQARKRPLRCRQIRRAMPDLLDRADHLAQPPPRFSHTQPRQARRPRCAGGLRQRRLRCRGCCRGACAARGRATSSLRHWSGLCVVGLVDGWTVECQGIDAALTRVSRRRGFVREPAVARWTLRDSLASSFVDLCVEGRVDASSIRNRQWESGALGSCVRFVAADVSTLR